MEHGQRRRRELQGSVAQTGETSEVVGVRVTDDARRPADGDRAVGQSRTGRYERALTEEHATAEPRAGHEDRRVADLAQIADLVGVWDGEACGPVQKRLHDLVTEKLAEAQRHIDELTAFRDQLGHAATQLTAPAADGPCSDECACMALDHALTPVPLTAKPG